MESRANSPLLNEKLDRIILSGELTENIAGHLSELEIFFHYLLDTLHFTSWIVQSCLSKQVEEELIELKLIQKSKQYL